MRKTQGKKRKATELEEESETKRKKESKVAGIVFLKGASVDVDCAGRPSGAGACFKGIAGTPRFPSPSAEQDSQLRQLNWPTSRRHDSPA